VAGNTDNPGQAGRGAEAYSHRLRDRYRPLTTESGDRLPSEVRSRLMPHLGFDPEMARLHTGSAAATASKAMAAEAFTVGRDVFFDDGRFDPASERGIRLLTHELAHVGQQTRDDRPATVSRQASEADAESPASAGVQLHREVQTPAPSTRFALPLAQPSATTGPPPSETATEEQGAAAGAPRAGSSGAADTQLVADRVYDLLKREIVLGHERGGIRIRRR
jgi:hypothetical protein